mmetsp:Transcript_120606/g.208626  ORF Transcript_120606/g.208626 Transcript_120606/m.208626 type:complete len:426 (-) Transcript_120606:54-1331(-)
MANSSAFLVELDAAFPAELHAAALQQIGICDSLEVALGLSLAALCGLRTFGPLFLMSFYWLQFPSKDEQEEQKRVEAARAAENAQEKADKKAEKAQEKADKKAEKAQKKAEKKLEKLKKKQEEKKLKQEKKKLKQEQKVILLPAEDEHEEITFAWMGSPGWAILFGILLLLETIYDKIPHVDHVLHIILFCVAPLVAAWVVHICGGFCENTNAERAFMIVGAVLAIITHALRGGARAGSTATTGGIGNIALSIMEDLILVALVYLVYVMGTSGVLLTALAVCVCPWVLLCCCCCRKRKRPEKKAPTDYQALPDQPSQFNYQPLPHMQPIQQQAPMHFQTLPGHVQQISHQPVPTFLQQGPQWIQQQAPMHFQTSPGHVQQVIHQPVPIFVQQGPFASQSDEFGQHVPPQASQAVRFPDETPFAPP